MSKADSILLIDDEPSVCDALGIVLFDHGYKVEVAQNGREGIEAAGREEFSLVITDLRLPDMSGLDVLRQIKIKNHACPVIVITAHGTPDLIVELKRIGALEVLAKPFSPAEILSLIKTALERVASCETVSEKPCQALDHTGGLVTHGETPCA
ncbi:MAG TPA: response regulator [Blastocatellia bacterium]|nr:response regulator [Blastocatellia bacterium]